MQMVSDIGPRIFGAFEYFKPGALQEVSHDILGTRLTFAEVVARNGYVFHPSD